MTSDFRFLVRVLCTAFWLVPAAPAALAEQHGTIEVATPYIHADGTMSEAARAAMTRGRLLKSAEEARMKEEANRAAAEEETKSPGPAPAEPRDSDQDVEPRRPTVVPVDSFPGQSSTGASPSDSTGAIGRFSYIQAVNTSVRIYSRNTHAAIATATLNQLAGIGSAVNAFDPQMIWDPTTNRFYYVMDAVFSSTNNKLAFGFSRTANPTSFGTSDWCKYLYTPADPARFPDYPKLGDSRFFVIIGVNSFQPNFVGSDLIAISKPPAGTACPAKASFDIRAQLDLRDESNQRVFTPVPANQIDNSAVGYVVARHGFLPANRLWFFNVTRNSNNGNPVFGAARGLTVPTYTIPPAARQPTFSQLLDTLDARPTQAVQAINPDQDVFAFYVQHTVRHPSQATSMVRWYAIDPAPAVPVLLRSGVIAGSGNFIFNAAISPDRRKDGATAQFGDSFIIQYNLSSRANNLPPRIMARSSVNGGSLTSALVKNAAGPYRDFTCPDPGDTCRWGDYSAATPDPRPTTTGRGEVWITNQYSGLASPPPTSANFRTWIARLRP